MLTRRHVTIISRALAGLTIALSGPWLIGAYYVSDEGIEINEALFVLLSLHAMGALAGLRASVLGIVVMIVFTMLAFIAPSFLNIPFRATHWLRLLYLVVICAQLTLLVSYLALRGRFASETRSS